MSLLYVNMKQLTLYLMSSVYFQLELSQDWVWRHCPGYRVSGYPPFFCEPPLGRRVRFAKPRNRRICVHDWLLIFFCFVYLPPASLHNDLGYTLFREDSGSRELSNKFVNTCFGLEVFKPSNILSISVPRKLHSHTCKTAMNSFVYQTLHNVFDQTNVYFFNSFELRQIE